MCWGRSLQNLAAWQQNDQPPILLLWMRGVYASESDTGGKLSCGLVEVKLVIEVCRSRLV